MNDDLRLLEAARGGDRAALETLLQRYEPAVYRFGVQLCRDPEAAREVLQETLLAAARNVEGFRGDASVATWLYTIARSFCIKQRRRGRSVALDGASLDDEGDGTVGSLTDPLPTPDEALEAREAGRALESAIASLPDTYREVLLLRDVEGLTAPEVARVTGLGVDAVKSRLHRARAELRRRLEPFAERFDLPVQGERPCPDVVRLFSQKLEGEIGPTLCEEMERHLEGCARCRARCDALRSTLAGCKAMKTVVPPELQASVRKLVAGVLRP